MNGVIGIDIGGTAIKMGLVSLRGIILAKKNLPFDPVKPFSELINAIGSSLEDMMASSAGNCWGHRNRHSRVCGPGYGNPDRRHPECSRLEGPLLAEGIFRTLSSPSLYRQ